MGRASNMHEGEKRKAYRNLVGKPEGNKLGIHILRKERNFNMDLC
jgi:hypothetical protein